MERNTYTTLGALQAGDRFVLKNDKKQESMHVVKRKWKKALVINAAIADAGHSTDKLEKWAIEKSYNIEVKFLRHTIQQS